MVSIKNIDLSKKKLENIDFPSNNELILLKNVLTDKQIKNIIDSSKHLLHKSTTGKTQTINNNRDSYSAFINNIDNKYIINLKKILMKIFNYNRIDIQLLYYKDGGFYNPHLDAFNDTPEIQNRKYSIFLNLNTPLEGGATYFTKWDTRIKAKKGNGILWKNLSRGLPDTNTEHTGEKVIGEKYALNIWIT